jgi:hypothetical protein
MDKQMLLVIIPAIRTEKRVLTTEIIVAIAALVNMMSLYVGTRIQQKPFRGGLNTTRIESDSSERGILQAKETLQAEETQQAEGIQETE